jgi:hypothetical protein
MSKLDDNMDSDNGIAVTAQMHCMITLISHIPDGSESDDSNESVDRE